MNLPNPDLEKALSHMSPILAFSTEATEKMQDKRCSERLKSSFLWPPPHHTFGCTLHPTMIHSAEEHFRQSYSNSKRRFKIESAFSYFFALSLSSASAP